MLYVISGVSGSGKSTALHVLEDLDYYCIDNLPVAMLRSFSEHIIKSQKVYQDKVAVGIDARNIADDIKQLPSTLKTLDTLGIQCEVIFFDADDNILLKRFSETRRKHPLTQVDVSLLDAIKQERKLLDPIASCADLFVDTSHYNVHQLRDLIKSRLEKTSGQSLSILFESFGYKHGVPSDVDFVFDVRCLPNPHWKPELRHLTGLDKAVIDYLEKQLIVQQMYDDTKNYLNTWIKQFEEDNRSYITVSIGCTGGQHRSVYMAQKLADYFTQSRENILTRHRELM